jgi:hypothetical protein
LEELVSILATRMGGYELADKKPSSSDKQAMEVE